MILEISDSAVAALAHEIHKQMPDKDDYTFRQVHAAVILTIPHYLSAFLSDLEGFMEPALSADGRPVHFNEALGLDGGYIYYGNR